jgi:hypothetical protein
VPRLSDTSPEAERVLTEVYRRLSPGQKALLLDQMYRDVRALHAAGVRLRQPDASGRDVLADWIARNLGITLPVPLGEPAMSGPVSYLPELRAVLEILDRLGLAYAVGGSMASSIYGEARTTRDADITLEPFPGREAQFAAAFGPSYYLSLPAIQDAVRRRSSFNIIDTAKGFKVDVFVRPDTPFEQSAMSRRGPVTLADQPDKPLIVHSPEDVILFKLRWYRLGNESSEQQWRDVLGVLRAQGPRLDHPYLDRWAQDLGVTDLLARARQELQA